MIYTCMHCECKFEKHKLTPGTKCTICGRTQTVDKKVENKIRINLLGGFKKHYVPKNIDDEWAEEQPTQEIGFCDEYGVLWESEERYADLIKWRDGIRRNLGKRTKRKG